MTNLTTNEIGSRSESEVLAALLRAGYQVLIPFGVARYDLAIDSGTSILRVQVKTGHIRNGAVIYKTASCSPGTGYQRRPYTADEIDLFAVYCPQTGGVYLVPIAEAGGGGLRLQPPRNNQRVRVRMASDYLLSA